ncbi:hypothetical protein HWV62_17948 [Athelia sp. TMB]|nr:hypothetical protein HWV62_17948 [Athelia sp. TMB]
MGDHTVVPSPSSDSHVHLQNEKPHPRVTTAPLAAVQSHYEVYRESPPSLDYSLDENNRKRYIGVWFALLFFEAGVLPLILFFALRWGAHLSITINLAIITSLIGSVSGYKFAQRQWLLWLGEGHQTRRPIGAGRWGVDSMQILLTLAMTAFFVPLIIGSSVNPANARIVALALPLTMLALTLPLLLTGLLPDTLRFPLRVSSLPAWKPLPPFAYFIVEDVLAVDGGGCTAFRQAWRVRYEESLVMRQVVRRTSVAWGVTGFIVAAGLIVSSRLNTEDIAYGLCYGVPWAWAFAMAFLTVLYVRRALVRERRDWKGASPTPSLEEVAPKTEEGVRRGRSERRGSTMSPVHKEHTLPIEEGRYDRPVLPFRMSDRSREARDRERRDARPVEGPRGHDAV